MKLALDLTHCSHSSAQTGIQQVARGLWRNLPAFVEVESVVFDKYADFWRPLDRRESMHLETVDERQKVKRKRPHWSTWQRIRGYWQRHFGPQPPSSDYPYDAILLPEFFVEWVGPRLPELKRLARGPMLAVFHDAIAFHEPKWGVAETIARYPQYLRELSAVDGVACVSAFSREQLLAACEKVGVPPPAVVEVVPLGLRTDHLPRPARTESVRNEGDSPVFLSVATIEPRKNHRALLAAAETLWREGFRFRLVLVGMLNRGSGQAIEQSIRRLQQEGYPLEWHGGVPASELAMKYQQCDATVFPSLCEGFGLPVLESLYFGKPCLSSNGGALAEVATGPGVLACDPDSGALTTMLRRYLSEPDLARRLAEEARTRGVRTMRDYAEELVSFAQHMRAACCGAKSSKC